MAMEYSAGALASAAMSLAAGLVQQLVAKGLLTRMEALNSYDSLASGEEATSNLYGIDDEKPPRCSDISQRSSASAHKRSAIWN